MNSETLIMEIPTKQINIADKSIQKKINSLKNILLQMKSVVVAFSGGADSTLLLKIVFDVLGHNAIAVTSQTQSIPQEEIDYAIELAAKIGIKHKIVFSTEFNDPNYIINDELRCYHCKKHISKSLILFAAENGYRFIIDGSNADDEKDYRPGTKAAREMGMRSPLREAGFTKSDIRTLSKELGLPTWNKPASPCLSTRIPYNSPITVRKIKQIEKTEKFVKSFGIMNVRVRHHDSVARIEVDRHDFDTIIENKMAINTFLKSAGFKYITLDIAGFRSGNLNEELQNG